jgi:serine/threonine protein kinase/Tol biopolymer transport system component
MKVKNQMTSERWQHIDELFHATLECAPEKRAAFLDQACLDDIDLRKEVESLLSSHERDGGFLDIPAYELAAGFLTEALGGLTAGQQIGPYKILGPLATGGMGEVYLAQDHRLGRKIALKLLPTDFARDEHRVRRFAQEARAASALNHPNVCVIYEVGKTSDGRHFIAMEHIDGITLRERINQGPLNLIEALGMAEQIAAALSAAHAAGVIHRDIKPENIMVRKDGYVKVLDFGLAKLSEGQSAAAPRNEGSTVTHFHTEPGTQMGTVRYMSPEHLRERPVDERADIWSFGVVLHEMVTGFTPFEARSRAEIIALILKKQTPVLSSLEKTPREFQQIVGKALSKDLRRRYSSVDDLAADLKNLRRQIQGATTIHTLPDPISFWKQGLAPGSLESDTRHKRKLTHASNTDRFSSALIYVSETAGQILTEIKQHPGMSVFASLSAIVLIFTALNMRRLWPQPPITVIIPKARMMPLTNAGQTVCAAISADGKSVAHAEDKGGLQQLVLTNLANRADSVIVPPMKSEYRGVTFSHDSNYLYFTRSESVDVATLYQISLPAGSPRKIKDGVDSPISLSPNGDRFAFVRQKKASGEFFLMLANIDGSDERVLTTRKDGNVFSTSGPAWSPDEEKIVCAAGWWAKGYHMNLVEVNVADGHEKPLGQQEWFSIYQVAWSGDKTELVISARERWTSPFQLWRIPYPEGPALQMTTDTGEYETASLTQDGRTLVAVQSKQVAQIWVAPDGDAQRARQIASTVGYRYGLAWTTDAQVVFSSMVGDNVNLSLIGSDGTNRVQLTANAGDNYTPATSPNGRYIVFASNRTGTLNIWRMNANDGSDARQLTFSDGNSYPSISADGQWIAYDNQSGAKPSLWKVSIDGGRPVKLTNEYARMPVISPDGQFVAYRYYDAGADRRGIAILPLDGGQTIRRFPLPVGDWQRVQWTSDSQALMYVDSSEGSQDVWRFDLHSNSRQQLTHFKSDRIFGYAWSPDYHQLVCQHGSEYRDVVLIEYPK